MGSYCKETLTSTGLIRYYCDWKNSYHITYPACYNTCLVYDYNGDGIAEPIPISKADFTLLLAFAGAIAGLLLSYAIIGASN